MKRDTAIRHAMSIGEHLRGLGGIISTPGCFHEALKIDRLWVFGSTAKGAANPSDLDLLVQFRTIRTRELEKDRKPGRTLKRIFGGGYRFKWDWNRRDYMVMEAYEDGLRSIIGGRRMIRFHDHKVDGSLAWPRVMLYPLDESSLLVDPTMGMKISSHGAFTFGQTWLSPKGVPMVVVGYQVDHGVCNRGHRVAILQQMRPHKPLRHLLPCVAVEGWRLLSAEEDRQLRLSASALARSRGVTRL